MKKVNILIVDDDISSTRTMSFVLEKKGYEVSTAKDGPEAIKKVRSKYFDLILMDIKMPLMDGVDTYKQIKKISPDKVVIMMTAYAVEDLVREALKEGAYGILYKPLDMEKVISLIEEALKNKDGIFILIVDDDPSVGKTLKKIFKKRNYKVLITSTGEEAIAKSRENKFDIAFIDVKLPTINGLETYLELKKLKPDVVAVMITAYRHDVDDLVNTALENNAYSCLYKPLDMEKLLSIIEKIRKKIG